jgi:tRNA(adenine34) deaminase
MWNDIEKGFQIAFDTAWKAFMSGTMPIGACILNENEDILAIGQNQIYAEGDGILSFHQLAHAEANAILKISEALNPNQHPNIRKYILYTTMEPCPFCFGAIVMGSIRNVKFAARDGWAGATALNNSLNYIKAKNIVVEGPFRENEIVQIAIQTYHLLKVGVGEQVINAWDEDCPVGVEIGRKLFEKEELDKLMDQNVSAHRVYEFVLNYQ